MSTRAYKVITAPTIAKDCTINLTRQPAIAALLNFEDGVTRLLCCERETVETALTELDAGRFNCWGDPSEEVRDTLQAILNDMDGDEYVEYSCY